MLKSTSNSTIGKFLNRQALTRTGILSILALSPAASVMAQGGTTASGQEGLRVITTAVPILTVAPDARAAALGDAGVATSPDANTSYWNPAKLGAMPDDFGVSVSYTPWLRKLINDMSLSYVSAYKRIGTNRALSFSLMYFDLGDIKFTDANGNPITDFNPKEYTIGLSYGQKLSDELSLGIGAKFIRSNLAGNVGVDNVQTRPGNSAAADIGVYFSKPITISAHDANLAFGAAVTNLGPRITYTENDSLNYLPTNLRLGTAFTYELDPFNKITFTVDANKLLVPTPPIYDENQNIVAGKPQDRGLFESVFTSFNDAPDGGSEELKEVNLSTGLEYWYNDLFAARAGYFYENPLKGNRQYFAMGLGVRYQRAAIDVAYLIPSQQNNPLAETLRFTLSFNFEKSTESDGPEAPVE